jgi:hypothetical protein
VPQLPRQSNGGDSGGCFLGLLYAYYGLIWAKYVEHSLKWIKHPINDKKHADFGGDSRVKKSAAQGRAEIC